MVTEAFTALGITVAAACAALLLKRAWNERAASRVVLIAIGWAVFLALLLAGAPVFGVARAIFLAAAAISVGALTVVASGIEIRPARAVVDKSSIALEPSDRPSRVWRGVLRFLLAGPIGGIAAMGVGVMWVVWLPADEQTRIVTGGLVVPVLWGALMAWTLSDDKIIRATAVLLGVAIVTFSAAAIRGFA